MDQIPSVAVGAVVAALIAGTVSLLGLIISKEQKTSEFRQAWIDALRNDLVSYLTHLNAIHDAIKIHYEDRATKLKTLQPLYLALNNSNFSILLRINKLEQNSIDLISTMNSFILLSRDESDMTVDNIRPIEGKFLSVSQDVLKHEWNRVKGGEITFRIAKFLALIVVVLALVGCGIAGYKILQGNMVALARSDEHKVLPLVVPPGKSEISPRKLNPAEGF